MLEPATVLQGRYLVLRALGQGGMGAVYEAIDQRFGSTVAIKQTTVHGDTLLKAFEREARLLNSLRHTALPMVMDYFSEDQGQFLVMQFIPGDDLAALLAKNGGAYPSETVLDWADQLLSALEYLHSRNPPIIHRDIKPHNLKLTSEGGIVLLDFGLAKGTSRHMTQTTGSVPGYTPHYASLEQMRGLGTDARSDIYSLGATLFNLLTGELPTDALTRADTILQGQPDPLRSANAINSRVPEPVANVLSRAMDLKRKKRPASASEMRREIGSWMQQGPHPRPWSMDAGVSTSASTLEFSRSAPIGTDSERPTIEAADLPVTRSSVRRSLARIGGVPILAMALFVLGAASLLTWNRYGASNEALVKPISGESPAEAASPIAFGAAPLGIFESTSGITQIALSSDGGLLLEVGQRNSVQVWRTSDGASLPALTGAKSVCTAVAVSPDGKRVAAGTANGELCVWTLGADVLRHDRVPGDPAAQVIDPSISSSSGSKVVNAHPGDGGTWLVRFSADGANIVTAGFDKKIRVWKAEGLTPVADVSPPVSDDLIICVEPTLQFVAYYGSDGTVRILSLADSRVISNFKGKGTEVVDGVFTSDGSLLVLGHADGKVSSVKVVDGTLSHELDGPAASVNCVAASPDSSLFLAGFANGDVCVWASGDGRELKTFRAHKSSVHDATFSGDGALVATADESRSIRLWRVR